MPKSMRQPMTRSSEGSKVADSKRSLCVPELASVLVLESPTLDRPRQGFTIIFPSTTCQTLRPSSKLTSSMKSQAPFTSLQMSSSIMISSIQLRLTISSSFCKKKEFYNATLHKTLTILSKKQDLIWRIKLFRHMVLIEEPSVQSVFDLQMEKS